MQILLPGATLLFAVAAFVAAVLLHRRLARVEAMQADAFAGEALLARLAALDESQIRAERAMREDFRIARDENTAIARMLREEVSGSMRVLAEGLLRRMGDVAGSQAVQLESVSAHLRQGAVDSAFRLKESQEDFARRLEAIGEANAKAGETLKAGVEAQLASLRADNDAKLEQMRVTVDEKLQGTLERRLGESFKLVSERLEAVHKGLGEMQSLATGVGDLKRVLTNVKSRGTWGEVQLGALLEQMLAPGQFAANVSTGGKGTERVEFAIRLPGHEDGREVLLPLDAKFPVEDYERLQAAADRGDAAEVETASKALEMRLRASAREICEKYVNPPVTTDFAILFLPTEGLYAEVIRRPGLCDDLQRAHRVTIAGPTTLTALLSSLQMGFRTLAIQKRSGEVWQVLGAVKTEFGRFGPILEKVKKKLDEASSQIDQMGTRKRAIDRRLRSVEALEIGEAAPVLPDAAGTQDGDEEDGRPPFLDAAQ